MRVLLGAGGTALGVYGVFLMVHWQSPSQLLEVIAWAAAGVILHDGVLAPLSLGFGWWSRRRLPAWVAIALTIVATTAIGAFAVLGRSHGGGRNATLLDRNYPLGLLIAALTIAGLIAVGNLVGSVTRRRRQPDGTSTGR